MNKLLWMSMFSILALSAMTGSVAHCYESEAQATKLMSNERPAAMDGVGIDEKLGESLMLTSPLVDEDGKAIQLATIAASKKPMILSIVYYTCPSLCNLHLNGLMEGLEKIDLKPGKDYELVALSMEPKDTPEIAKAKKATYIKTFGFEGYENGIHFLTGKAEDVKATASSAGFKYKWDEPSKQWSHTSAAILVSPEHKITRYIHGITFEPKTLKLSLVETANGKVGGLTDQFMLFCFNYNAQENRYAIAAFNVMRLGAGAMVILLALWLIPYWLRARKIQT